MKLKNKRVNDEINFPSEWSTSMQGKIGYKIIFGRYFINLGLILVLCV